MLSNLSQNKLLILLTNAFPFGNSEPYLITEVPYLAKKFNKVIIIPINPSDSHQINLPENVEVKLINKFTPNVNVNYGLFYFEFLKELPILIQLPKPLYNIRYFRAYLSNCFKMANQIEDRLQLKNLLSKERVVLYSYWTSDLAIIAAVIKKHFPKLKTISRAHGYDVFEEQNENYYIPFRDFQFNNINCIYSVSKYGESYLKNKYPKYQDKLSTNYLGTEDNGISKFESISDFKIVTCSVIRNIKRLELMIDILKFINFDVTWHVVGNGPDENNLKKISENLPHNIKVVFHGYLNKKELNHFYKTESINLFCSLSSSEGLPVSMMEAISYGIPVMSTDVGGCREICNEKTGFLIQKDFKPLEVADLIETFKNSEKNSENFRNQVRQFWKDNFNADVNYKKFADKLLQI